jgi:hypothetical protein
MPYIPKTLTHKEKVAILKDEVLRYSRMGLQPRHIAAKLDIPTYSVYNYKMLLQKEGIDVSVKDKSEMTRGDRIVKSKVIKYYNSLQKQEESTDEENIPVEETNNSVFIPLEAKERENVMISFEEDGIKIFW